MALLMEEVAIEGGSRKGSIANSIFTIGSIAGPMLLFIVQQRDSPISVRVIQKGSRG